MNRTKQVCKDNYKLIKNIDYAENFFGTESKEADGRRVQMHGAVRLQGIERTKGIRPGD
jgi:hypothetical protein